MFVYFKTTQHRGFDEILNDEDDEKTLIERFLQKRIENGSNKKMEKNALQKSMSPDHPPSRPPKSPDSSSYSVLTNSTVIVLDDDEDISENENSLSFVDFSGYQIGNQRGLRRKQMQKLWKLFLN